MKQGSLPWHEIFFVSDSLHTENKQKKMSRENTINVNESISAEI